MRCSRLRYIVLQCTCKTFVGSKYIRCIEFVKVAKHLTGVGRSESCRAELQESNEPPRWRSCAWNCVYCVHHCILRIFQTIYLAVDCVGCCCQMTIVERECQTLWLESTMRNSGPLQFDQIFYIFILEEFSNLMKSCGDPHWFETLCLKSFNIAVWIRTLEEPEIFRVTQL